MEKGGRVTGDAERSEFAGFLARPALDHDFRFGEEFHRVTSLAVQNAEETLFPPAEREIRHRRGDAEVDADITGRRFVAKLASSGATGGEQRRLSGVRTGTEKFHGFVHGVCVEQAQARAKTLRVRVRGCGWKFVKNR